jgi:RimJ/RimL family protein N-acetyltransferase
MLVVARSMRELPFEQLMSLYAESNQHRAMRQYPHETLARGMALVEQDFSDYLRNDFFVAAGAMYCLWMEEGEYVSALRLEPWKDGLLVTALETVPAHRGKGYACALLTAVQSMLAQQGDGRLYSHVHRKNEPSILVHEKCGFRRISDVAVFLDGSVDSRSGTYMYENGG